MKADATETLFKMLADPTRRRMLDLIAERGPLHVGALSAEFPDLVASGISKHLMGLRAAGLVSAHRDGRQQIYALEAEAMGAALAPWLRKYDRFWQQALERLRDAVEEDIGESGAEKPAARKAKQRRRK
jgi:DNA-binding transcriptional ArsR family regulator